MPLMQDYAQYVLVRVTPDNNKLPVNANGDVVSALDPANWLPFREACAIAAVQGLHIGFVLTESDPFFCLDIDHCLKPDGSDWTPTAYEVLKALAGGKVEVSVSGKGLHIWGSYTHIPQHRCKNTALRLELYHSDRFIVLGSNAQGSESADMTALLPGVINRWFAPDLTTPDNGTAEWTTEPCEGWSGPTDDNILIEKALASVNSRAIFGATVSFRDLWECNAEVLGTTWPGNNGGYDASSADAALAQRLAFWTGKNCDRIQRLMERSALRREKYDRPDYLPRTIMGACRRQTLVYSETTKADVEVAAERGGWVTQADMPAHFKGCVYVEDRKKALTPDGFLLDSMQFDVRYGGNVYVLDERKSDRSAWKAFTQNAAWRPPFAHGGCFRPSMPFGEIIEEEGRILVNTYSPPNVPRTAGDASRFTNLLRTLLPKGEDANILLAYLAACVQYPGVKFTWCPILQGVEGNGKTLVSEVVANAVGKRYSFVLDTDRIKGAGARFNDWIDRKLFVTIEEIFVGRSMDVVERLKPLITNRDVALEGKGIALGMIENCANFLLLTNYMDAMPVRDESRRYAPFVTAQQRKSDLLRDGLTNEYFLEFYNWLNKSGGWAITADFLASYPIPAELNPAGVCRRAPDTSGRQRVVEATRGEEEEIIREAVAAGLPGFCGGWISGTAAERLLHSHRSIRMSASARSTLLDRLGYVKHPGLPGGRASRIVSPDGVRATLWIGAQHPALQMADSAAICQAYEKAQVHQATESPAAVFSLASNAP